MSSAGGRAGRRPDRGTWALLAATAGGSLVLFLLLHRALVDDAFITLSYARTLGLHGDWGIVPGFTANTATSPLNVLLLGGLVLVLREPMVALGVVYVASAVLTAWGLRGLGRELGLGLRVAVVGTPLLVASPLLLSTVGLETTLVVAALTHLAWAAARADAVFFGLVGGVLVWLRLDASVLVLAVLVCTPVLWRYWWACLGLAALVVTPWLVFSWVALESAVPDTLVLKADTSDRFLFGLIERFGSLYPWAVTATCVVTAAGLLATLAWPWWRRLAPGGDPVAPALAAAGVAYYLLMVALGVPVFFWYYAPTVAALTIVLTVCLARLSTVHRVALRTSAVVVAGILALVGLAPLAQRTVEGLPWREMPVHGNWATPAEYRRIATELGDELGDVAVRGPGEIGALSYYCECVISDRFSNRSMLVQTIEQAQEDSWLMRLNYARFDRGDVAFMRPQLRLRWRPGPDPTDRGWDVHGAADKHLRGHFELVPFKRIVRDRSKR